jgi:putative transposase
MHPMPKTATHDIAVLVSHAGVPLTRPVTFVFTLDPSAVQRQMLSAHAGAFRLGREGDQPRPAN